MGRNAPRRTTRDAALATAPADPHQRIDTRITRPLLYEGRVYRLVDPPSGQTVVEEWSDGYWRPSLTSLALVRASGAAPFEVLRRLAVPGSDWLAQPSMPWLTPTLVRLLGQLLLAACPVTDIMIAACRAGQALGAA